MTGCSILPIFQEIGFTMNRRKFLKTSAGFTAVILAPGVFSVGCTTSASRSYPFREYESNRTFGKVRIVSPEDGYYIHTFFDVCPFSPSQRFLAVTRIPFQDREIQYGDQADVCVIDLETKVSVQSILPKAGGFRLEQT
jgi:hypothetical protein